MLARRSKRAILALAGLTLLVAVALVPLTMFGLTMLERSSARVRTGDR